MIEILEGDQQRFSHETWVDSIGEKKEDLWVKFLHSKYGCRGDVIIVIEKRKCISNVWKGVCSVSSDVEKGLYCIIGDGQRAKFWVDKCLREYSGLIKLVVKEIPIEYQLLHVNEYLDNCKQWDVIRLRLCFAKIVYKLVES